MAVFQGAAESINVTVKGVTFDGNTAFGQGGAVILAGNETSLAWMTVYVGQSSFKGNSANDGGGALMMVSVDR